MNILGLRVKFDVIWVDYVLSLIGYKIYNSRHFANYIELYTQLGIY